ncbi:hypothetical protein GCM10023224_37800 [Streptomonospora halophila]|uniref:Uncharacterized protein n=1 Tax=Streptomonospora halophila TaxID=427369 RepID=A0ABP9GTT9_9ACTN
MVYASRSRYPREAATRDFHEQVAAVNRGADKQGLPFWPPTTDDPGPARIGERGPDLCDRAVPTGSRSDRGGQSAIGR